MLVENMKRAILLLVLAVVCGLQLRAQHGADSTAFKGYLYNKEYKVYMRLNLLERDVVVTWQDLFGPLPGFLGKDGSSYCWLITDATVEGNHAELELVNDSGSDDLVATLTQVNDSTFTLRQGKGATIRVPNNGKWQKLPHQLTFIRKNQGK